MTNIDSILKSRDITLPTKVRLVKAMVFPVVMYGCASWTVKKAEHQRIDAFELWCWRRLLRVPWTARRSNQSILKEIQPVHPKGDKSWMFVGRADAEAETPILWPPHAKSWLTGKDSDAGRDWGQEKKGTTEDEMAGWHHQLEGHEFEWTPGVDDGQGGLVCCDSRGCKELDTTEWLNWLNWIASSFAQENAESSLWSTDPLWFALCFPHLSDFILYPSPLIHSPPAKPAPPDISPLHQLFLLTDVLPPTSTGLAPHFF